MQVWVLRGAGVVALTLAAIALWGGSLDWADQGAAKGTNGAFWHERQTSAPPGRVWQVWTDVSRWKDWDLGLADARLEGPFQLGAKGVIIAKGGQESEFIVTEYTEDVSYAYTVSLPGATLEVRRQIKSENPTLFRHDVTFHGVMSGVWALLLGGGFRMDLPPTMDRIAETAER